MGRRTPETAVRIRPGLRFYLFVGAVFRDAGWEIVGRVVLFFDVFF
jgi:hypothetical protein